MQAEGGCGRPPVDVAWPGLRRQSQFWPSVTMREPKGQSQLCPSKAEADWLLSISLVPRAVTRHGTRFLEDKCLMVSVGAEGAVGPAHHPRG